MLTTLTPGAIPGDDLPIWARQCLYEAGYPIRRVTAAVRIKDVFIVALDGIDDVLRLYKDHPGGVWRSTNTAA